MVGQHIRILKSGRWVHAVDCGDETVLHLVEDAPPPRVRRAYRPEFLAGAEAVEVVTHRERAFPATEIVKRAYSRASDPALAVMFGDSEAFVEWCTTGRLLAARNVALEVPGVPPVAPSAPAAPRNGAPRASPRKRAARPKAAARAAAKAKAPVKPARPARPARKVKRAAVKARKAAVKAKPPAKAQKPGARAKRAAEARKPPAKAKARLTKARR